MFASVVTIFCDAPDCTRWEGEESTLATAIAAARHAGWLIRAKPRGARHFCPMHRPDRLVANPALRMEAPAP